jgi:hypothetical protein
MNRSRTGRLTDRNDVVTRSAGPRRPDAQPLSVGAGLAFGGWLAATLALLVVVARQTFSFVTLGDERFETLPVDFAGWWIGLVAPTALAVVLALARAAPALCVGLALGTAASIGANFLTYPLYFSTADPMLGPGYWLLLPAAGSLAACGLVLATRVRLGQGPRSLAASGGLFPCLMFATVAAVGCSSWFYSFYSAAEPYAILADAVAPVALCAAGLPVVLGRTTARQRAVGIAAAVVLATGFLTFLIPTFIAYEFPPQLLLQGSITAATAVLILVGGLARRAV